MSSAEDEPMEGGSNAADSPVSLIPVDEVSSPSPSSSSSSSNSSEEGMPMEPEPSTSSGITAKRPASPLPSSSGVKKAKNKPSHPLLGHDLTKLAVESANSRLVVPILSSLEHLTLYARKKYGLKIDINKMLYPSLKREVSRLNSKRNKKKIYKGDNGNTPGEFDVEEIVDGGLTDEGNEQYLVKWKGWQGSNTWEPVENLGNCWDLVKKFHEKMKNMSDGVSKTQIIELSRVLTKLLNGEEDMAILLKLNNKSLKDLPQNRKEVNDLKNPVREKSHLVLEYLVKKPDRFTDTSLLEMTIKALKINQYFGSLKEFLDFCDARVETRKKLEEFEDKLNQKILAADDGPETVVENYVDTATPLDFEYTAKYETSLVYSDEIVVHCSCTDCGQKNKNCCIKECYKRPYNEQGTLLLDPQQAIYECNSKCHCGDSCPFKVVSKGRKFKLAVFRTDNNRGWGLKTLERIPKGKFVITYMGELITVDEAEDRSRRHPKGITYQLDLDYNPDQEALFSIDAQPCGNLARYINHSCDPNLGIHPCWIANMDINLPTIAFFTKRVINRGEELSFDYNMKKAEEYEKQQLESEKRAKADLNASLGSDDSIDSSSSGFHSEESGNKTSPTSHYKCNCGAQKCRIYYM